MELVVRIADSTDINNLVRIVDEYFSYMFDFDLFYNPYSAGEITPVLVKERYHRFLQNENCHIFIAELDSRLVGFIEVWLYEKNSNFSADKYGYISNFYIDEQTRKFKQIYSIMNRLYKSAEQWVKLNGYKYLVADAYSANETVLTLFRRVGLMPYRVRVAKKL